MSIALFVKMLIDKMHNLLLITSNPEQANRYLETYSQENQLEPKNIYRFGLETPFSVEEFRQILKLSQYRFNQLHLFIIYHFNQASTIIQNTFLKTLEEHQPGVVFVLVADNLGSVLPTIISRCQIKTLKFQSVNQSNEQKQEFNKVISQISKAGLASSVVKLGIKDKKIKAVSWLKQFLNYGYQNLHTSSNQKYLAKCLKRAIINLKLIEANNLDPETGLDQVFLSWLN